MPGLDGAIECAMEGMLLSASSRKEVHPLKSTIRESSTFGEQNFGLSRPIMQGIRARVGFLRKRAETAPAQLETPVPSSASSSASSSGARFIAGDVGGLHEPIRLMEPLTPSSRAWRRSVVG